MDLAIVVAVFPVIFLGELPDKTMLASLVMATRGKPFSVWLGAAGPNSPAGPVGTKRSRSS